MAARGASTSRALRTLLYFHALLLGLFPGVLDLRSLQLRASRLYLVYSAILHGTVIGAMALLVPMNLQFIDDLSALPLQQFVQTLLNGVQMGSSLLILIGVWCQRRRFSDAYCTYRSLVRLHRHHQYQLGQDAVTRRAHRLVALKVGILVFKWLLAFALHARLLHAEHILLTLKTYVLTLFMFTVIGGIVFCVSALCRQFGYVNVAVRALQCELFRFAKTLQPNAATAAGTAHELALRVRDLAGAHFDWSRLTLSVFRSLNVFVATTLLEYFIVSLRLVHFFVRFVVLNNLPDVTILLASLFLMAVSYWDFVLYVDAIEALLKACNRTGELLRESTELRQLHRFHDLSDALDDFAGQVRAHKLCLTVCGLFKFSRETSFQCVLAVLVHVTVMLQFEIAHDQVVLECGTNSTSLCWG